MMHFEAWQWVLLALGAVMWGISKTGVPSLGFFSVAIYVNVLPARQATGVVLPLLILADGCAYVMYRNNLEWRHVGRLLSWAVAGIGLGWFALGRINDAQTARVAGAVLALMLGLHFWRQRTAADRVAAELPSWAGPMVGLLAGFTTMVANAAGPLLVLYLLAMRLPKLQFLGTSAAFFLLINWIKLPFIAQLGLINSSSLSLNLWLAPAVIVGGLLGRRIAQRINQRTFEMTVLALTSLATAKLLFF